MFASIYLDDHPDANVLYSCTPGVHPTTINTLSISSNCHCHFQPTVRVNNIPLYYCYFKLTQSKLWKIPMTFANKSLRRAATQDC